jgi:hypothetical protein
MPVCPGWRVRLSALLAGLLLAAAPAYGQSIVDARRVEFTPSPDHNAVNQSGTPLIDHYSIDVYLAGAQWPVASAILGKPAPDPDGFIRVDFVALLPVALATGVNYEALVESVGPGGRSGGTRTNTFSFGATVCNRSASPTIQSFTAAGGTGTSTVTAGAGCAWTAASNVTWVTIVSGASGSGPGTVTFSVAANTATTSRVGTLTIAGTTFTVQQAGAACTYGVSPTSQSFAAAGGGGSSNVTSSGGCAWSATSNASWITVTSGASGLGSGTANFTVAPNTVTSSRSGSLTIAGTTFNVTQAAASCTYSIAPASASFAGSGGTGSSSVTAGGGCAWSATSNVAWITVTSGATGSGSGTVGLSVAANGAAGSRTGTVTIAGSTFTVTQGGASCSYSISPATQSFTPAPGSGSSTVTAGTGCAWSAISNASWIAVTSGASGSGPGVAGFSVDANTSPSSRSGTLTIAGRTFTVTQSAPCSYNISATSVTVASDGGPGSNSVTAAAGCGWSAASNAGWITVTSGASGSGAGSVGFNVAANTGTTTRTGTITIAGTNFIVTQGAAAPCNTLISPTTRSFTSDGGSGNSTVSAGPTCAWTADSNVWWVAVLNAGPGRGNGTVTFIVATNSSGASRTGTLAIAGKTFTVTQTATASCTYTVTPGTVTATAAAAAKTVSVTTQNWCPWTVSGLPAWVTASGTGPGTGNVTLSIAANLGQTSRTATLTIAGQAVSITQGTKPTAPANLRIVR